MKVKPEKCTLNYIYLCVYFVTLNMVMVAKWWVQLDHWKSIVAVTFLLAASISSIKEFLIETTKSGISHQPRTIYYMWGIIIIVVCQSTKQT